MHHYAFVDGAYLRSRYSAAMQEFFGEAPDINPEALAADLNASRIYYYDRLDEAPLPFRPDAFAASRGWHLRPGWPSGERPPATPRTQGGIQLAVDMLTHVFRKNCGAVSLVAGDPDFKPLVEAVVGLGAAVDIWYDRHWIATELLAAADGRREMTLQHYHKWTDPAFRREHAVPESRTTTHGSRHGTEIRHGLLNGANVVRMFQHPDVPRPRYAVVVELFQGRRQDLILEDQDQARLLRYCEATLGDMQWTEATLG
jgi:hypothetical protein